MIKVFDRPERAQHKLERHVARTERAIGGIALDVLRVVTRLYRTEGFVSPEDADVLLHRGQLVTDRNPQKPRPRVVSLMPRALFDANGHSVSGVVATLSRNDALPLEGSVRTFGITITGLAFAQGKLLEPHAGYYPGHAESTVYPNGQAVRHTFADAFTGALVAGIVVAQTARAVVASRSDVELVGSIGVGEASNAVYAWRELAGHPFQSGELPYILPPPGFEDLI